jgi:hypothetical protein
MSTDQSSIDAELESLQHDTFSHFLRWTNPENGLVLDETAPDWPASIAGTGPRWRQSSAASSRAQRRSRQPSPRCDFSGAARKA